MFVLPNNKQINMEGLEEAFLDIDSGTKYYLDAETGEVVRDIDNNKEIGKRYFETPKLPAETIISWMREFVVEMVYSDSPESGDKLLDVLKKENPINNFLETLENDESGWIYGWPQWKMDHVWEEVEEWFCTLPVEIEDDMSELDDDCPLCRMMKEGVNDLESLQMGFIEANAKQVIENLHKNGEENKNDNDEENMGN